MKYRLSALALAAVGAALVAAFSVGGAGAGHQAVELRRVEIGADRPILILDFAPVGQ